MSVITQEVRAARAAFMEQIRLAAVDGTLPSVKVTNGVTECRYRHTDEDGKKHRCLAGLLLDEDDVVPEGGAITNWALEHVFSPHCQRLGITAYGLRDLQAIHDRWARDVGGWNAEAFIREVELTGILRTEDN